MKPEHEPHVLPAFQIAERILEVMARHELNPPFDSARGTRLPWCLHALDERSARESDRSQHELGGWHRRFGRGAHVFKNSMYLLQMTSSSSPTVQVAESAHIAIHRQDISSSSICPSQPGLSAHRVASKPKNRHNLRHLRMRILPVDHPRRVPWKNGLGFSLELVTDALVPGAAWTWRLALVNVPEAGPFSEYPGIDRAILLVEGAGLLLEGADKKKRDVPKSGKALAFAGEEPIVARPFGPGVRDANLMLVRSHWRGALELLAAGPHALAGELLVIHAYADTTHVSDPLTGTWWLAEGETLVTDSPCEATLQTNGRALAVTLHLPTQTAMTGRARRS